MREYKPISSYALIGDQKTCALVGLDGAIDWLCVPRFDSPSVFGAILDAKKGGSFKILPDSKKDIFEATQSYEDLTNILVTEFRNSSGHISITDFMPCFRVENTMITTGEIHRRVSCVDGAFSFRVIFDPRPEYGKLLPKINHVEGTGYSFFERTSLSRQELALLTPLRFRTRAAGGLELRAEIKKGEPPINFVLRIGGVKLHHNENPFTEVKLESTREFWKSWIQKCPIKGKWKDMILRSALLLRLLVYSPTGAIIAAPTTSLPEEIGGQRNWDYRYSWIRDSTFVLWAMHSIGFDDMETGYLSWITSIFYMMADNLQVMLGISGERDLTEKTLKTLSGYKDSAPVRIGNGAWDQLQLDVYGILLDAIYFSHKHGKPISRQIYDYVLKLVLESVEKNWEKPDCGIWEVRREKKNFVYSKMWCWVAMDRATKIAESLNIGDDAKRFANLRDKIRSAILENGYNKSIGAFVRSFGTTELDSANLLMPQVRFIEANDPRMLSTIEQTIKRLNLNGFLYRYKADDGLRGEEGAFLMCSFWLVTCLTMAGDLEQAEKLLDSLVKCSNHVGLFSEEIDPKNGEMLGNFPQAFTHMGFIAAAAQLSKAIERQNQSN